MGLSSAIISFFGLPLLSLLLIPALSSYTTSLNVLFFYMTWTTIVMSHPYIRIELVFSLLARTLAFILPSVLLFLFDILVPSAAILWKRNGEQSLPMGKKRGGIRLQDIKVVCWSLFNVLFGVFLQAVVEFILIQILGLPSALNGSMFLPTPWGMVQYLGFLVVFRDVSHFLYVLFPGIFPFSLSPCLLSSHHMRIY